MASNIRWKKSDYITLGKAVSNFNKQVKKLESLENDVILPDLINYKEIKSEITTRQELNRMINSLKRISQPSKQRIIKTDSGIEITAWQLQEAKKARKRASKRLEGELAGLSQTLGTGNKRINEIKGTLKSFENLETANKEDFKRIVNRIFNQGTLDYNFKKAKIFQENFISAYKKLGRTEIVEIAKSFKNPEDFWDYIKDSELIDLSLRYDEGAGLVQIGEMNSDEIYYYELNKLKNR